MKMATLKAFTSLAVLAVLANLAVGADLIVGAPNGGWDTSTNLQSWATPQTFSVGDNLNFQYTPNHSVLEVSKADYDACQTGNPIQVHNGGNTTVPLSSPGKRYFICGTSGHCAQGMKLEVDTVAATTASPPSPPPASSPPKASPQPSTPPPVLPPSKSPSPSPKSPSSAPSKSPSSSPASSPPVTSTKSPGAAPSGSPSNSPTPRDSPTNPSSSSAIQLQAKLTVGFAIVMMVVLAL